MKSKTKANTPMIIDQAVTVEPFNRRLIELAVLLIGVIVGLFLVFPPTTKPDRTELLAAEADFSLNASQSSASLEQMNENLVRRVYDEVLTIGNIEIVDALFVPTFDYHEFGGSNRLQGIAHIRALAARHREDFFDLHYTINSLVADGDWVVVCWMSSGYDRSRVGHDYEPLGVQVSAGVTVWRILDGKIIEAWTTQSS
jgi:predicted ester cyclase